MPVSFVSVLVVDTFDDFVAFATIPAGIFSFEKHEENTTTNEPDSDVSQHNAMSQVVKWTIIRPILD